MPPIYEYQCSDCDHEFEEIQKLNDDPLKDCPKCETKDVLEKKMTTQVSFKLKGKGWYRSGGY